MSFKKLSDPGNGVPAHVLICGLGSIGRRHLRHLRDCGVERIDAFRTGRATLRDEGQPQPDRVFLKLEEALAQRPEAVVVANPTALHIPVALAAVRAGCHVLVEKPVSHTLDGCVQLAKAAEEAGVFIGTAYNLRFHPLLPQIRQWISDKEFLGRVLFARAHIGGYLPDWHPWEDYLQGYAARRDLGGGAALTNSHEIDALLWLLGPAEWSAGTALGAGPLGTDVDEAAGFCFRHQGGAVSMASLSLVQRPPARTLAVDFENGRLEIDLLKGTLSVLRPDGPAELHEVAENFTFDQTYRDQMRAFFDAIHGKASNVATLEDGVAVLKVVKGME